MTSMVKQAVLTIETNQQGKRELALKVSILILLSFLNASVVILTHYARTRQGDMFLASSAVVMSEGVKVTVCLSVTLLQNPSNFPRLLYSYTFGDLTGWGKTTLPACIYALQNNLVLFALSHLNSVTFQVTYQLKIGTTAVFSVILLRKSLHLIQWLSLLLLFCGVAVVQTKGDKSLLTPNSDPQIILAVCSVLSACILSGFGSVYFEKILKSSSKSVWAMNIQLGIPGAIFAFVTMLIKDYEQVMSRGFFHGYDVTVWILITLQATGGLLVACVVKYTDNILKTFAMAKSILISIILSAVLFNTDIDLKVLVGSGLVISAVFMYSLPRYRHSNKCTHPQGLQHLQRCSTVIHT